MLRDFPLPGPVHRIRDPKNFYADMRADVALLLEHKRYLALTTVIMCCLDALAADSDGSGKSENKKFERFMKKHFHELCALLDPVSQNRGGARILYDNFRNGFAHNRGPKLNFVIAEDSEVDHDWAGRFPGLNGQPVGINVDRLATEFLALLDRFEQGSS